MRLLISVRSVDEAWLAAQNGADFIDLKEPGAGALGGLPIATIRGIVAALREQHIDAPVSATIGDIAMHDLARIAAQVEAVGACGVDYVKVGIEPGPDAEPVLRWLSGCGRAIVPVLIADRGIDAALVAQLCATRTASGAPRFPALMADTADKLAGNLFDVATLPDLRRFVADVRAAGMLVGLAGALRLPDLPTLADLAPDFAGFRSAVCLGHRGGALNAQLLRSLAGRLHTRQAQTLDDRYPSSKPRTRASSLL